MVLGGEAHEKLQRYFGHLLRRGAVPERIQATVEVCSWKRQGITDEEVSSEDHKHTSGGVFVVVSLFRLSLADVFSGPLLLWTDPLRNLFSEFRVGYQLNDQN